MAIIVKSKTKFYGECLNTFELLQALKSPVFESEAAPVSIKLEANYLPLTMVYLCDGCSKLHLVCGQLGEDEYIGSKSSIHVLVDHTTDGKCVSKSELIEALECLFENHEVIIENLGDPRNYPLTEVFKCHDKCPAVHLDCGYERNCIYPN